jgi:tyrosyl-DNA phosphodiesterase-1
MAENLAKRRRIEEHEIQTLQRAISPPPFKRRRDLDDDKSKQPALDQAAQRQTAPKDATLPATTAPDDTTLRSPFRLTAISDLDPVCNADALTLDDLLGGPDLTEAWLFDYLFDLDFVMSAFSPAVRDTVSVKIVHGSWQADSSHRAALEAGARRHRNVEVVCAWMPERFGTHHSKMMVLFHAGGAARVAVHTANMIPKDWGNMTQGAWASPPLPPLDPAAAGGTDPRSGAEGDPPPIGSGARFKADLLRYLEHYDHGRPRTAALAARLRGHDFGAVRAAFLASAPGSEHPAADAPHTLFGWPGLAQILRAVARRDDAEAAVREEIVVQVSSVATVHEKWMAHFQRVLSTAGAGGRGSGPAPAAAGGRPRLRIVFPAEDEIRASLDGYASGASIHLKGATTAQQNQLRRLRPLWCRWSGGAEADAAGDEASGTGNAMRGLAAPHVKTYARLATARRGDGGEAVRVRWALITSANLSTQAWGAMPDAQGRVRVCSYEVGVLVWPELLAGDDEEEAVAAEGSEDAAGEVGGEKKQRRAAEMVPVFGRDSLEGSGGGEGARLVPLRLPYGLPLEEYRRGDRPWCGNVRHEEPDWLGQRWDPEE